jgi:putative sigma-54 modulation protein
VQILYTGKPHSFSKDQIKLLDRKFAKISKLVDGRGEKELHIFFSNERRLMKAEATLNYYGHSAVGEATEPDAFQALADALEKLERQVLKVREKWRESKRAPSKAAPVESPEAPPGPRIVRRAAAKRKPITVDEAVLLMKPKDSYFAFRDAETENLSVLVRRPDGNFDLIEG